MNFHLTKTHISINDHISNGDKLGIIDRLTRTIKNILNKYVFSTVDKNYSVNKIMKMIIDNYNDTPHSSLNNNTPNEVFKSHELRQQIFNENKEHNDNINDNLEFKIGDNVRILENKNKFDKEKPRFSKDIYTIVNFLGYKFELQDDPGQSPSQNALRFRDGDILNRLIGINEMLKVNKSKLQRQNIKDVNAQIQRI